MTADLMRDGTMMMTAEVGVYKIIDCRSIMVRALPYETPCGKLLSELYFPSCFPFIHLIVYVQPRLSGIYKCQKNLACSEKKF